MTVELAICLAVQAPLIAHVVLRVSRSGLGAHELFALSSLLFVCLGADYLALSSERPDSWRPVAILTAGVSVFIVSGEVLGFARRASADDRSPRPGTARDISDVVMLRSGILIVLFAGLYFVILGYVPLLSGLQSAGDSAVNTSRVSRDVYINESATYIPLQGLFEAVRYFGLPVAFLFGLRLRRLSHPVWGTALVMLSLSLAVATAQRWPLVYFLVAAVMTPWLVREWSKRRLITLGSAWLLGFVLITAVLGRTSSGGVGLVSAFWHFLGSFLERVFVDQMRVPFASYFLVSADLRDLNGATWAQSLRSYLPGQGASFPVDFYKRVTGDPTGYTAPPDAFTEAYLNFGLIGVVVFAVIWSWVLAQFDSWMVRRDPQGWHPTVRIMAVALGFTAFSGVAFALGCIIVVVAIEAYASLDRRPTGEERLVRVSTR